MWAHISCSEMPVPLVSAVSLVFDSMSLDAEVSTSVFWPFLPQVQWSCFFMCTHVGRGAQCYFLSYICLYCHLFAINYFHREPKMLPNKKCKSWEGIWDGHILEFKASALRDFFTQNDNPVSLFYFKHLLELPKKLMSSSRPSLLQSGLSWRHQLESGRSSMGLWKLNLRWP